MNFDEYLLRNPKTEERIKSGKSSRALWTEMFTQITSVAWSSFIYKYLAKTGPAYLYPTRTGVYYTDMTAEEYDEQLAINEKFQRMHIQEKREKELRKAAAEYDCC